MAVIQEARSASQRREVADFYETVGYGGGLRERDLVLVARREEVVIGAVRLCQEEGCLVLRGMHVAEAVRGAGVGRGLLHAATDRIGRRECWCVPFGHLRGFYGTVGFTECSAQAAPVYLAQRCAEYMALGLNVAIMHRPASAGAGCETA